MQMISELASTNDYWSKCETFLKDIQHKTTLSHGMNNWLCKIENDYEDQHLKYCKKD
jgi:hypothetical protein